MLSEDWFPRSITVTMSHDRAQLSCAVRRRRLDDGDGQRSPSSADTYYLGLSGGYPQSRSWKEVKKLPVHDEEPAIWCFIDDPHRSPGFDRDGIRAEHNRALLINNETDDDRGGSARCLSDACWMGEGAG